MVERTEQLFRALHLMDMLDELDLEEMELEELDPNIVRRRSLLKRERRSWETYIRPMLGDKTFKDRFRMEHEDFMALVELLRSSLQRDVKMGALRNGAVPVEYQLAVTLRWLAGASIYEGMDGHVIARSTAYAIVHRVIDALNALPSLGCKWPVGVEAARTAEIFRGRSEHEVVKKALGAMDGLFVRLIKPTKRDHGASHNFFSGHKKGHGMNLQVGKEATPLCIWYSSDTIYTATVRVASLSMVPRGLLIFVPRCDTYRIFCAHLFGRKYKHLLAFI